MTKTKARKVEPKRGEKLGKSGIKKIWGTKQVLSSQFAAPMPSSLPGSLDAVTKALQEAFPTPILQRKPRPNKKSSKFKEKLVKDDKPKKPSGFILGVNQVTKGLERDELSVVVVARDVMQILVSHLPILCYLKKTKLVPVSSTGAEMAHILGTQTALAFGIRKFATNDDSMSIARNFHDSIIKFAVKLKYPWVAASQGDGPVPSCPAPEMKPHVSVRKIEQSKTENRNRKRKRGSTT